MEVAWNNKNARGVTSTKGNGRANEDWVWGIRARGRFGLVPTYFDKIIVLNSAAMNIAIFDELNTE